MSTLTTTALGSRERHLTVDTASTSEPPFLFVLDSEILLCRSGGGTLFWTVDRHVNGTKATSHAIGATVIEVANIAVPPGFSTSSADNPIALAAAGNVLALFGSALAAGDSRDIYARLYFDAIGASGEAVRAYAWVRAAVAQGGTVNGIHASLNIATGGSISGEGQAARATLMTDGSVTPGGTLAVIRLDTLFGANAVPPDHAAFLATDNMGTPKLDLLAQISHPSSTMFANAGSSGTGSAGYAAGAGIPTKVLKIEVDNVPFYLPLYSTNA